MKSLLVIVLALSLLAAAPATQPTVHQKNLALLDHWRPRIQAEHLHVLVADPFLIVGDGSPQRLARYRDGTVLAAARALEATYFEKDLQDPVIIFLFESEAPYKRLAKEWFNDDDVPHYGFYRNAERCMFMNVATGTGTLVHELTHALIAPDFPSVPSWFNEGLASLYEQCSINGTTITGLENWRLPALQKAIRANQLRPLKELIQDPSFYRSDLVGINYAQARYLMLYLQQQKLLQPYYREFRDHAQTDPTGLHSLEKIIAPLSRDQFESKWRDWVLTLHFD